MWPDWLASKRPWLKQTIYLFKLVKILVQAAEGKRYLRLEQPEWTIAHSQNVRISLHNVRNLESVQDTNAPD